MTFNELPIAEQEAKYKEQMKNLHNEQDARSDWERRKMNKLGHLPDDDPLIKPTPLPSGTKFDTEKPRLDLLDPLALEGLAAVLTFGAKKYAAHNWRGGISYSRLLAALLRHSFAILRGEDVDPESGLPHVDHVGCCWMFLSFNMKRRPDLDDRWKPDAP